MTDIRVNPYEPHRCVDTACDLLPWPIRVRNFLIQRASLAFVAASLAGAFVGVAIRAGLATAVRDTVNFRGLSFFTLLAIFAALASLAYRPVSNPRRVKIARVAGGLSLGSALLLLEPYANRLMRAYPDYDIRASAWYFFALFGSCILIAVVTQFLLTSHGDRTCETLNPQDGG